jgi:hypothetical protein
MTRAATPVIPTPFRTALPLRIRCSGFPTHRDRQKAGSTLYSDNFS